MLGDAPLEEPLLRDGVLSAIWARHLADMSDALKGDQFIYRTELPNTGTGTQTVMIKNFGPIAIVSIKILSATTGILTLPFSVEETILSVWDLDTKSVLGCATVNGALATLPTLSGENIMITGSLVK